MKKVASLLLSVLMLINFAWVNGEYYITAESTSLLDINGTLSKTRMNVGENLELNYTITPNSTEALNQTTPVDVLFYLYGYFNSTGGVDPVIKTKVAELVNKLRNSSNPTKPNRIMFLRISDASIVSKLYELKTSDPSTEGTTLINKVFTTDNEVINKNSMMDSAIAQELANGNDVSGMSSDFRFTIDKMNQIKEFSKTDDGRKKVYVNFIDEKTICDRKDPQIQVQGDGVNVTFNHNLTDNKIYDVTLRMSTATDVEQINCASIKDPNNPMNGTTVNGNITFFSGNGTNTTPSSISQYHIIDAYDASPKTVSFNGKPVDNLDVCSEATLSTELDKLILNISATAILKNIKVVQDIPVGFEVVSMPSGWVYNASNGNADNKGPGTITGEVPDINVLNDTSDKKYQVVLRAIEPGLKQLNYKLDYDKPNGQSDELQKSFGTVNVIDAEADINVNTKATNPRPLKYQWVDYNINLNPIGQVKSDDANDKTIEKITNINYTQTIPSSIEIDSASLPTGWTYSSGVLKGKFDDVAFITNAVTPPVVTKTIKIRSLVSGTVTILPAVVTAVNTKGENITRNSSELKLNFLWNKLKILEVYGFKGSQQLVSNGDADVVSMSIQKFISSNTEELNGQYDAIYFGNGYFLSASKVRQYYMESSNTDNISQYDITDKMANKLIDFINSNQLVVFNNSVFNDSGVDFRFRNDILNYGSYSAELNPVSPAQVQIYNRITGQNENKRRLFRVTSTDTNSIVYNYAQLASVRAGIQITSAPVQYTANSRGSSQRILTFKFNVKDYDNQNYTYRLYFDRNGDGNFVLVDTKNPLKNVEEVLKGSATGDGSENSIVYNIPDSWPSTFLAWKLEVKDEAGKVAFQRGEYYYNKEVMKIKVLQIIPNSNTNSWDIKSGGLSKLDSLLGQLVNTHGGNHQLGNISNSVDIQTDVMTAQQFDTNENYKVLQGITKTIDTKTYLPPYDIVVMGFCDTYAKPNKLSDAALNALEDYMANKRQGIMFTHDTIWGSTDAYANSEITNKFRSIINQKSASTKYTKNGVLTDQHYLYSMDTNAYGITSNKVYYNWNNGELQGTKITLMNKHAITQFPYVLSNQIPISKTHIQYYQLNVNDDGVTPLFNMCADSANLVDPDDSINSYYTYSKGNVTFSGTGHTPNTLKSSTDELELFVNTMVKTYGACNHAPSIDILSPEPNYKVDINSEKINFKVRPSDFDWFDQDTGALKLKVYIQKKGSTDFTQVNQVYIDTNNDGKADTLAPSSTIDATSDVNLSLAIDFVEPNLDDPFKVKFEIQDPSGVKNYSEIQLGKGGLTANVKISGNATAKTGNESEFKVEPYSSSKVNKFEMAFSTSSSNIKLDNVSIADPAVASMFDVVKINDSSYAIKLKSSTVPTGGYELPTNFMVKFTPILVDIDTKTQKYIQDKIKLDSVTVQKGAMPDLTTSTSPGGPTNPGITIDPSVVNLVVYTKVKLR